MGYVDMEKSMQNIKKAVLLSISAAFVFSIMNMLVKYISHSIPSTEVGFFRGLFGLVYIAVFIYIKKVKFSKTERGWLLLRGFIGSMYVVVYFFALSVMPLGDLNILVQLSGLFVILFSSILLKEKLSMKMLPYVFAILLGAYIIINPLSFSSYTIYSLLGVISAIIAALVAIVVRRLSMYGLHHPYEIIFYFLAVVTVVTGILSIPQFVMPNGIEMGLLLLMAFVSVLAQIMFTAAFASANAIIVEIVAYIGVIFNGFWGIIIFGESIGIRTILGAVLIVGASIQLSRK